MSFSPSDVLALRAPVYLTQKVDQDSLATQAELAALGASKLAEFGDRDAFDEAVFALGLSAIVHEAFVQTYVTQGPLAIDPERFDSYAAALDPETEYLFYSVLLSLIHDAEDARLIDVKLAEVLSSCEGLEYMVWRRNERFGRLLTQEARLALLRDPGMAVMVGDSFDDLPDFQEALEAAPRRSFEHLEHSLNSSPAHVDAYLEEAWKRDAWINSSLADGILAQTNPERPDLIWKVIRTCYPEQLVFYLLGMIRAGGAAPGEYVTTVIAPDPAHVDEAIAKIKENDHWLFDEIRAGDIEWEVSTPLSTIQMILDRTPCLAWKILDAENLTFWRGLVEARLQKAGDVELGRRLLEEQRGASLLEVCETLKALCRADAICS